MVVATLLPIPLVTYIYIYIEVSELINFKH